FGLQSLDASQRESTAYWRPIDCAANRSCAGGHPARFRDSVIARVRTTLSLRPSGRTVGGEDPAARGSTGCTLNLDESKRSILSKLSSISTIFLQAPRCWQDYSTRCKLSILGLGKLHSMRVQTTLKSF